VKKKSIGPTRSKPAGIKEIAAQLGVSIGTVDRALHGRPGIKPSTASRVMRMAERLRYQPNMAARLLKLNRKLVISVHLPQEIAEFFDLLRGAIRDAARPFHSTVDLQFHTYPTLGDGDVAAFELALQESVDGIILAPGNPHGLKPLIRRAVHRHIPVVCVATDAPSTERLMSISTDPHTSGSMVAELLTRCVRTPGPVLVITGSLSVVDHTEKMRGFAERLSLMKSPLSVVPVLETHDNPLEADQKTRDAISRYPDICAVYVTTANSLPVLRALRDTGHLGKIAVVTTDLFPALIPYIRSGEILATVYQRPQTQGRIAFEAMYRFLTEKRRPPARQPLPPHLILQSNLDLFVDIMQSNSSDGLLIPSLIEPTFIYEPRVKGSAR
jgi:LacI family transcriptional regulator, galactose operon repressor